MTTNDLLAPTFWGYRRANGPAGVRNHLLVVPSVICANTVAERVAALIPGAVAIPHPHGCAQVGDDVLLTERVLAGAAANPNVGAALVIGLGCETCQSGQVADLARKMAPAKPIESFSIQEAGGSIKAIARGIEAGKQLMAHIAAQQRVEVPLSELVLGAKLGDATATVGAEPAIERAAALTLAAGATIVWANSTNGVAKPPTGRVALQFASRPPGVGDYVMDTPPHDQVSLSALAAGGAQVCLFATPSALPLGNAICPVVKVCPERHAARRMTEDLDLALSDDDGANLFRLLLDVCNGRPTVAELIGHQEFAIHRIGPTV